MPVHSRPRPRFRSAVVLGLALVLGTSGCVFDLGSFTRTEPLEEKLVRGEDGPKLAMIELEGLLSESVDRTPFGLSRPSVVARVRESLDIARDDDDVSGLLLRIRSPGGTVSASEVLYHELLRFKAETGRPVVAYLQGLATSGGYYAAMAADEIIAHPTAVTGSIGVVMAGVNLSGLMERFGVEDQTFTSGAYKDSGSPLRPMRPDERAQLQSVIDDLHARFREVVGAGRPDVAAAELDALADGRILTARQALAAGLIDRVGHLDDAVAALEARASLESSRLIIYHRPGEYRENVYSRAGAPPVQVVDVDVLSFAQKRLEPGFYYLWPGALGAAVPTPSLFR